MNAKPSHAEMFRLLVTDGESLGRPASLFPHSIWRGMPFLNCEVVNLVSESRQLMPSVKPLKLCATASSLKRWARAPMSAPHD